MGRALTVVEDAWRLLRSLQAVVQVDRARPSEWSGREGGIALSVELLSRRFQRKVSLTPAEHRERYSERSVTCANF